MEYKNTNFNLNQVGLYEFEEEDDLFYAELRKQVLLLTEEEEENFAGSGNSPIRKPGSSIGKGYSSCALGPGSYFNWWENGNETVPTWLVNLWRNNNGYGYGTGTGVFIPTVVKSRRRRYNKSGNRNNQRRSTYKPVEI